MPGHLLTVTYEDGYLIEAIECAEEEDAYCHWRCGNCNRAFFSADQLPAPNYDGERVCPTCMEDWDDEDDDDVLPILDKYDNCVLADSVEVDGTSDSASTLGPPIKMSVPVKMAQYDESSDLESVYFALDEGVPYQATRTITAPEPPDRSYSVSPLEAAPKPLTIDDVVNQPSMGQNTDFNNALTVATKIVERVVTDQSEVLKVTQAINSAKKPLV